MTDVALLPAVVQAGLIARRELSASDLLEACLARIEAFDGGPGAVLDPPVNAVVTRTVDAARARAAELDAVLAGGGSPVGPLHGLVVGVKDLHETAGVRTTYGSPVYADHVPAADHLLVTRLRAAGAVIVGKTNTPEFGAGSQTVNPVFGPTRNPWDRTRTAGGSSGGAAAAVAAGFVSLADGSDVGGSLRNPPAFCGVVGLRPSPGRVPQIGPGHVVRDLGAFGAIGRDVADAALGLAALAGPDLRSLTALPEPGATFAPPLTGPPADRPPRIAFSEDLGGLPLDPAVRGAVRAAAEALAAAGWQVEEAAPPLDGVDRCFETLRAWLFAADPGRRLSAADRDRVKATVRQEIADGERLTGADLTDAFDALTRLRVQAREFLARYDALLAPATQVLPFDVGTEWVHEIDGVPLGRYTDWMRVCSRLTVLGVPVLALPCGPVPPGGLPVGVQLAGTPGDDLGLLRLGVAAERVWGQAGAPPLG